MPEGITQAEFARRDGCSPVLVGKAVRRGVLPKLPDGTIDPALVGTGWRPGNRQAIAARTSVSAEEVVGVARGVDWATLRAAERRVKEGELLSIPEAEVLKENYLARLRQLEYEQKAGALVPSDMVTKLVGSEYAKVRTRLMAIPSERAPMLHQCKTVPELQDALTSAIIEALEELAADA